MSRLLSMCIALGLLLILSTTSVSAQVIGVELTYQGKLQQSGSDANGVFDFRFKAITPDNEQVGPTIIVNGVQVTDGLFQVELDFGAVVFSEAGTELQIEVRDADAATYTLLAPNSPISTLPRAGYAGLAKQAESLVNPIWTRPTSSSVQGGGGSSRLLFNRDGPITGADFFTLGIPNHGGLFGGMYIDAFDSDQLAFYGFSIDGIATGWLQYRDFNKRIEFKFDATNLTPLSLDRNGVYTQGDLITQGRIQEQHSNGTSYAIGPKAYGVVSSGNGFLSGHTPNVVNATWMGSNGGGTAYCVIDFDTPLSTSNVVNITPREDNNNLYASYEIFQGSLHVYIWDGSRSTDHSIQSSLSFVIFGN